MAPKITLTSSLRIDRIGSPGGDTRSGRSPFPFSRGQMLQGVVTGKNSQNQFYLDVNGTRYVAESRRPLQVGQQLDLQVVATRPRTTLQVVDDPLSRDIGKSLHRLIRQDSLLPETASLAQKSTTADLSPRARQTLDFFAAAAARLSPHPPPVAVQRPRQVLAELTARLAESPPGGAEARQNVAALRQLLGLLARNDTTRPETAALAREALRELDTMEEPPGPAFLVQRQPAGEESRPAPDPDTMRQRLERLEQALIRGNGTETRKGFLLSLFPDHRPSPSRLLLLILDLHQQLGTKELHQRPVAREAPGPRLQGKDLKQMIDRLGLDMERLLARGRQEEAAQTLKSALSEISQTTARSGQADQVADRLLGTIELFQMLQIRLAPDGLFFLPLPLPFLGQGYLLVEHKPGNRRADADQEAERYSLHLQLEGLGNIQVDISRQGKGVDLRFLAQDPERAGFMAEYRHELEQWLTALRLDSVRFLAGAEDPASRLLQEMLPAGRSGILDMRA